MPIDASPSGTLDIENATLRSREIVALTNMVAGNDVVRSDGPALEVYGDPGPRLELVSNTAATDGTATFTRLESNVGVFSIQSGADASTNGPITFGGFANERMRITSDGKVGVGTVSPDTNLHVMGDIIGRSIFKTRTITKGTSLSGEVNNFAFEADENRILLNNNQGSVGSSRDYTANFITNVPTVLGTIIHLEINSARTNNSASGVNHRTTIQFNSVDVLSTGNIYLPPTGDIAYQRNLKRSIILTTAGWVDYSLYPCVSKSVGDDAVIVSATNNARKASVGADNPLTEVMRAQLNGFGDPQVGINCTPTYNRTLDVNGSVAVRSKMLPDNLYTHYHNTAAINYAGNTDISTTTGFIRGSTGTAGTLGTSWYLWSIQRADSNPFERAFGYFYKYIAGTNMSASGSMTFVVLSASGVTATASGNDFRLITSSNAVNYPTPYAIRIVRLGLEYGGNT